MFYVSFIPQYMLSLIINCMTMLCLSWNWGLAPRRPAKTDEVNQAVLKRCMFLQVKEAKVADYLHHGCSAVQVDWLTALQTCSLPLQLYCYNCARESTLVCWEHVSARNLIVDIFCPTYLGVISNIVKLVLYFCKLS